MKYFLMPSPNLLGDNNFQLESSTTHPAEYSMKFNLEWTGNLLMEFEFETMAYTRFTFGGGVLWPDNVNPHFYLISRYDRLFPGSPVRHLIRAPPRYAQHLRCLLGDIAIAQAAWYCIAPNSPREMDHRHIALGTWLKYHDSARDLIFDEIRHTLEESVFSLPLSTSDPPKQVHDVYLPILEEWSIKRRLGIHRVKADKLTSGHRDAFKPSTSKSFSGQFGSPPVAEADLQTLCHSISQSIPIPDGSPAKQHIHDLLAEKWLEEKQASFESTYDYKPMGGLKESYWKRETEAYLKERANQADADLVTGALRWL